MQIVITEQSGARWAAQETGLTGERAVWVQWIGGQSLAQPACVGFYASSINAACNMLNN